MVAAAYAEKSFSERLSDFLDIVEYRRLDTEAQKEEAYRLRYDAYVREGTIPFDPSKRFADSFDEAPNVWIFGLYLEGTLASSIRIHVASPEHPEAPATAVFPDLLMPHIERGQKIIDPTRFVANHALARTNPELPYATVRLGFMASEYFNADMGLATVRVEHRAFYKRIFGLKPLGEPRLYPNLAKPICLMSIHYPTAREGIMARYPYLRSTEDERAVLFDRAPLVPAFEKDQPKILFPTTAANEEKMRVSA